MIPKTIPDPFNNFNCFPIRFPRIYLICCLMVMFPINCAVLSHGHDDIRSIGFFTEVKYGNSPTRGNCKPTWLYTLCINSFLCMQIILLILWLVYYNHYTHYRLIGGLEHFLFFHILGIIIPIDFPIFQRGRSTTNQIITIIITGLVRL